MIASVSGRRISMRLPRPGSLDSATEPRSDSMFLRTTSMPTPRPLRFVTFSAVEKPGSKIRFRICASGGSTPRSTSPRSQARCSTRSRWIPRPSSSIRITMLPASWHAASVRRPCGGLPAATRSAGGSSPWSSALRTTCISGSVIRSTTDLSSSVSVPTSSSETSLPSSAAVSRTTRRNREKVSPIGTIRNCSVLLRISSIRPPTARFASISAHWRDWRASIPAPAAAITSSPSRLITASSRSACTRMKRASSPAPGSRVRRCRASAASTTFGSTPLDAWRISPRRAAGSPSPADCRCARSACCSCARLIAPTSTRMAPSRSRPGIASIARTISSGDAPGSRSVRVQSSRTKLNAASIASRRASVCSSSAKPR